MRYIGSKARVLDFIDDVITDTYGDVENTTVADLFAGTACVSEYFKRKNAAVISNDYLVFSYAFQVAKIKLNTYPTGIEQYQQALKELNGLKGREGFFAREYTLEGTKEKPYRRNYFSLDNARRIDDVCYTLASWLKEGRIGEDMFYLLSASLIDGITKVSNTSGTYGAFLKNDDQRKFHRLELAPIELIDNKKNNKCYCKDIFEVIDEISEDILYLDPPYNSRQYPPYYHILETAVLYDNPEIYGKTGRRHYEDKISPFCVKDKAFSSMLDIVKRAKVGHVYISYSTEGIVPYKSLCKALNRYGKVECFFKDYRRYKSNSKKNSNGQLKEIIIYVNKE